MEQDSNEYIPKGVFEQPGVEDGKKQLLEKKLINRNSILHGTFNEMQREMP